MIYVRLPDLVSQLANTSRDVELDAENCVTQGDLIDVLERRFPTLKGALRDISSGQRRPFVRFFANEEDISQLGLDAPLPENVINGSEVFQIIGAIAGG